MVLGLCNQLFAQDQTYARNLIDTLASPGMSGRGYVNDANNLASKYIASEMERVGLKDFGSGYFQQFSLPMNTFPDSVVLSVNGKHLTPGRDFTVAAFSPDVRGDFKIKMLKSKFFEKPGKLSRLKRKNLSDNLLLINRTGIQKENQRLVDSLVSVNFVNAAGFILQSDKEKLMWSVYRGNTQKTFPAFEVLTSVMPEKPRHARCNINADFNAEVPVRNVIGYIQGTEVPDSFLVITAHYDHLGMMGSEALFPGANDNASGVSMMLDLARHFALPENRPRYSMAFLAFAGEEAGLLGSQFYAANPFFPLSQISFLINLDMVGTGSEGITVVNGKTFTTQFDQLVKINADNEYILKVAQRGESCNSDHCPFYKEGVPAVFIYSMGKEFREYHNIYDRPEQLPLSEYEDIFRLIRDFIITYKP